MNIYLPLAV